MGREIDRETFTEAEYARFGERLERCLAALRELLQRPGFGAGPSTVGAELELFLVDREGRPLSVNQPVLEAAGDPSVSLEIDRFNLELNPPPSALAGMPFTLLGRRMAGSLEAVRQAVGAHGGQVALIGILPTLRLADLRRGAITDAPRYRALDRGLRRLRQEPVHVRIHGPDQVTAVEVESDDVALEGANTSFQVHLRVAPDRFAAAYNAGLIAMAPALAAAGNSPFFLGHPLWEETRIALFEQSADDQGEASGGARRVAFGTRWAQEGALELFEESVRLHEPLLPLLSGEDPLAVARQGGVPRLEELRLHQGTVWRWNRAVYDASAGGHLRLELRPLPSGPTVTDVLANAAFLLGLTLAITPEASTWARSFPFARARANFYRAAQRGLDAELSWLAGPGGRQEERVGAAELVLRLLPWAREALERAGVDRGEAGRLLAVIEERVAARQTGAAWQRRALAALRPHLTQERALGRMLERYLELSGTGQPVHTWPASA